MKSLWYKIHYYHPGPRGTEYNPSGGGSGSTNSSPPAPPQG